MVILGDLRTADTDLRAVVQELAELEAEGLIVQWGVNNWSAANIRAVHDLATADDVAGPVITQRMYSVSRRSMAENASLAEVFETMGVSLQSSSVFEGGVLLGKGAERRHGVHELPEKQRRIAERIAASVDGLRKVAESLGATPAQLCPAFTSPIQRTPRRCSDARA